MWPIGKIASFAFCAIFPLLMVGATISALVRTVTDGVDCNLEPVSNHTCVALTKTYENKILCMSFSEAPGPGPVWRDCAELDYSDLLWNYQDATWPCYRTSSGHLRIAGAYLTPGVSAYCSKSIFDGVVVVGFFAIIACAMLASLWNSFCKGEKSTYNRVN